jgi:hypothetical protein
MCASNGGHTETLALLLANKADVHVANKVIVIIFTLKFFYTLK